jgi:CelD/BcsL family acetyltransferase involved in cellulose biosynthesis
MMTVPLPVQLSVEELRDRAAIAALTPEWERLRAEVAAAGGTAGPFLSPAWFAIFAAAIADDLRLLVAHRGGRLVGVLPLMMERRRLARLPARILRSLSDDHSQRFDVLLSPSEPQRVAAALWQHIARMRDWDALELREIPDGMSGAARLLEAASNDGYATHAQPAMRSPFLALPAQPGSSKFRANLRRRAKKLETELGQLSLERVTGDLDAALDEGLALEKAGWKGELGTAIACDPQLRRRYSQLAHAFAARDQLALCFLRAGQRRVAFHFALLEKGIYYLFKPGFDPALSHFGLGHLLVDEVIRRLPIRELDFLGDDMPWKRDWTESARPHSWRYVLSRGPWGRVVGTWKFALVPELKRALKRG